jgi:hypothetical protein
MNINKFTYMNPDSDGDINLDLSCLLENDSDFDIELVRGSVIIVNNDGVTIGGEDIDDDRVFIASKDSGEIDAFNWCRIHKDSLSGGSGADCKAYVSMTSYRREFVKVGSLDVPTKSGEMTLIKKVISLGGAGELMGVSCLREKDDDEGEMQLNFRAGVRNTSDQYISRAQVTIKAMDQRDAQIEDTVDYASIPSHSGHVFEPSFYGLKYGKLKNGTFEISASVYLPVSSYSAEGTPVLEED